MRIFSSFFILLFFISCSSPDPQLIELSFEKDLIPEGIAINPNTETLYLNSLKYDKIVFSNLDGNDTSTFIVSNQFGYLSGFGMTVKSNILYALGNSPTKSNNQSVLLMLNLDDGKLIKSIELNDSSFTYLNDLAVSKKGEIFITDSESNRIYQADRKNSYFKVFLDTEEVRRSNGIAISDDGKYLYLASLNGIRIIDLESKKIINKRNNFIGIDGLKFYKNSLISVVNSTKDVENRGIFRYYLNATGNKIINVEKIIPQGDHFFLPTTCDIYKDHIYYLKNTQLHLRRETDLSKLVPYILVKKKLE